MLVVILQGIPHSFNEVTPNSDWNDGLQWDTQWVSVGLSTSIEKLQWKAKGIRELDAKIAGKLQYPEELGRDIFEAVELPDGITGRVDQIKHFISRHTKTVEPLPTSGIYSPRSSSLSVTAQLFLPLHVVASPSKDGQGIVQNQSVLPSSGSHGSMASQTSYNTCVSRLPKLSLPSFSDNPLSWQTF